MIDPFVGVFLFGMTLFGLLGLIAFAIIAIDRYQSRHPRPVHRSATHRAN